MGTFLNACDVEGNITFICNIIAIALSGDGREGRDVDEHHQSASPLISTLLLVV